jgi:hypothetical protein
MNGIIEESRRELAEFAAWFNKIYGQHPLVIGGWAVDHYNPWFGSKDVDVIFEAKKAVFDQSLLAYFKSHNYQEIRKDELGMAVTYRKPIGGEFIDIDVASIHDSNRFRANTEKQFPYSLAPKDAEEVTRKTGSTEFVYRVPRVDHLLLYKSKALHDRDYDINHTDDAQRIDYLTFKRNKDAGDILALLDSSRVGTQVDYDYLARLVLKHDIRDEVLAVLEKIQKDEGLRRTYPYLKDKDSIKLLNDARSHLRRART